MNAFNRTAADLAATLNGIADPKPPYRQRAVIVAIMSPDGTFLRAVRCVLGERTDAGVADAIVTMIGDYATRVVECGADGKPLNASELLDASLKRDLAEPPATPATIPLFRADEVEA